jgi:tRNA threonylcarbamoyl adenosine modification protein YeaZ
MIGLALDTSHLYASVAIIRDGKILCYKSNEKPNKQAETINLTIEDALNDLKMAFQDLDYVAVAAGPGRFTGLRVGISVANAIKTALKLPLISVSNFEAIAHNHTKNQMGIILEAGVGKFYFQSFDKRIASSEIIVVNKDEAEELKKTYFFVGNVEIAEEQFALDARHIACYADHMPKEMINSSLGYLKPQYIINNYVN